MKKLAASLMTVVEINGITGLKPTHQGGNGDSAGSKQEVGMIGNQRPGKTGCLGDRQKLLKTIQKVFSVVIISEYLSSLDPPDHDVMQGAGSV